MLWKGGYPFEYTDDWEKFNEISLPEKRKKRFLLWPKHRRYYWCGLYALKKRLKRIKITNLEESYVLLVESDRLLLGIWNVLKKKP